MARDATVLQQGQQDIWTTEHLRKNWTKKIREMKMRRKPEKERGQKTVYSAFWPAERPRGL